MNGSPDRDDDLPVTAPVAGDALPTEDDLLQAAGCIRDAVDEGRLDVAEAGRRLAAIYRARSARALDDLVQGGAPGPPDPPPVEARSFYLWAAVRVTVFAALAAVLLYAAFSAITLR